ncbi:MAG: DUF4112 domain-containing protein [Chloroflexi bacterium]|nr:MAG: DUF4112 domain-containing protein [Chloroflexota bacterium]
MDGAVGARTPSIADAERRIALVARVLDELITIPGTRQRFGLDSIVGLIPGVGDLASAAVGGWIIVEASRFRLPGVVLARMVVNTVVDLVIGSIPLLGDVFDVVFKSNTRNLALFRRHATDPGASTTEHRAFLAGLVLVLVGLIWLAVVAIGWLLSIQIPVP